MEVPSSEGSSASSSPFSSPNVGALLKIRVISWSQETGLPATIHVRVGDKKFNLHKQQLVSKSGYFKKILNDSTEIELPDDFPGGPETFEKLALLLYGSSTMIDPSNVASLRCAAEFLDMTEDHSQGNLCERFDLYLNRVVLQSWDDTMIVLEKCQSLLPWSEELLIVSRCLECLAFMACMEILDPEKRQDQPFTGLDAMVGQTSLELWIKDLIALPLEFFKRVVASLRRQGMRERYICPMIVFYANKWVISNKTTSRVSSILEGVLDLLIPLKDKACRLIPVGFYFALLSRALEFGSQDDTRATLKEMIASSLHLARVEDFLSSGLEVATMESIVSRYVSFNSDHSAKNSMVAELWDSYISNIALDLELGSERFIELIERVPIWFRQNHDQLYKAINSFLRAHSNIPQEEKGKVCKYLSCQKMSQEVCIEAVQNELMPLRLIVQALFVQQLDTHRAFEECSSSFRCTNCGEFSKSLNLGESPYVDVAEPATQLPLSLLLHQEVETQNTDLSRKEFQSSFRIQSLEKEIMSLKRSLQWQNIQKKSTPFDNDKDSISNRKNSNVVRKITNCIGLLKIFRQITLFRSKKPNSM